MQPQAYSKKYFIFNFEAEWIAKVHLDVNDGSHCNEIFSTALIKAANEYKTEMTSLIEAVDNEEIFYSDVVKNPEKYT